MVIKELLTKKSKIDLEENLSIFGLKLSINTKKRKRFI